jgi:putative transposase
VPWRETSAVDERLRFIAEYLDGMVTMTDLCTQYGISRETGYKWVARFEADGPAGLHDRSRRPHGSPTATPPAVVQALLAARRRHPRWGPKKLLAHGWPLPTRPALSTASALLKQHGLVVPRRRRTRPGHPGRPTTPLTTPNVVWTIDFKGQFRTGDGTWCYPLTVADACTRYLLACQALPSVRTAPTRATLERVFRRFGLPDRIRSDNGAPFATSWALGHLSPLAVWWIRLGIVPERIEPGCPAQNGRHERMHRTLKADTARPPATTARAQQRRFTAFRRAYNEERPHEALEQRPPAQLYVPSTRPYPARLLPLEYAPSHVVRRVGPSGSLTWHSRRLSVSHTLIGQDVGLLEVDDARWAVYFGPVLLGHFDERRWCIQPIARMTSGALAGSASSRPAGKTQ